MPYLDVRTMPREWSQRVRVLRVHDNGREENIGPCFAVNTTEGWADILRPHDEVQQIPPTKRLLDTHKSYLRKRIYGVFIVRDSDTGLMWGAS